MNQYRVECSRSKDDVDDEPRVAQVFASDPSQAEQLCKDDLSGKGYDVFRAELVWENHSPGPARIHGYEGEGRGPFSWGKPEST